MDVEGIDLEMEPGRKALNCPVPSLAELHITIIGLSWGQLLRTFVLSYFAGAKDSRPRDGMVQA